MDVLAWLIVEAMAPVRMVSVWLMCGIVFWYLYRAELREKRLEARVEELEAEKAEREETRPRARRVI